MNESWTLHIVKDVTRFIYSLPRGQAASLRDALNVLRTNPQPENVKPLIAEELPDVYEVWSGSYRIQYQLIMKEKIIRILFVE
jgi:mRNA-degrading endonuclease RelE of RelBE toxin-antitoxin system